VEKNKRKNIIIASVIILLFVTVGILSIRGLWKKDIPESDPHMQKPLPSAVAKDTIAKIVKKLTLKPKTVEKIDSVVEGTLLDEDGNAMVGVVVSDGYTCQLTDSAGHYHFRRNLKAKFVYYTVPADCEIPTHADDDFTANAYLPLEKEHRTYDFTLKKLPMGKETNYRLLVIGDPQVTNAFSPYYTDMTDDLKQKSDLSRFQEETMADIKQMLSRISRSMPVYAISMGDNVQYYGGFNENLEMGMRKALGSTRVKVFSVIGNHDQDNVPLYTQKWEEAWGPTDYSFDRGDEHYVVFNDVKYYRAKAYFSPGELSNAQMNWLKQDLTLTDKSKKVVLCYHVPLTFGNGPMRGAIPLKIESEKGHYASSRLSAILKLLDEFKGGYELFCGHTHFALNHVIPFADRTVYEHCHGAACGNIWQSNINICGTPNGYYVYSFSGNRIIDSFYKCTFMPVSRQMSLFWADTDFNGESYVADWNLEKGKHTLIANVFNADSQWKVYAIEKGKEHEMTRISSKGQDAFSAGYHHKYAQSVSYRFISKSNNYLLMNHLYYYVPEDSTSVIKVKVVDRYGHQYSGSSKDVVNEPFFNYAHSY